MAQVFARKLRNTLFLALFGVLILSACGPGAFSTTLQPPSATPGRIKIVLSPPPPQPVSTQPAFQGPLSVRIQQPADNETVTQSPVEIRGEADPGTVVTINDTVLLVDANRAFSVQATLDLGTNLIEITASDPQAHQGFAYLTVFYEPQP